MNLLAIVGSPRKRKATGLNATTIGDLYAGDIEHRGADFYFKKAFDLGRKLV